jgi:lysine 2,3-aminomutase
LKEKYTKYIEQQFNNSAIRNQYIRLPKTSNDEFSRLDPLNEDGNEPVKGLIHKYDNRVLIKVSYKCAAHCQFCTRIRQIGSSDGDLTPENIIKIADYIRFHKEISDVILSGGDPFYTAKKTSQILNLLEAISNIRVIRIGTRLPIHNPQSFDSPLIDSVLQTIKRIQEVKPVIILLHVEHPDELTMEVLEVIKRLKNIGLTLLSQTVFLKGINNNYEILHALFEKLYWNNVIPYYIYRCDYVKGLEHFVCDMQQEVNIMTKLKKNLSGIACPTYVIDVEGKGKIPVPLNFWKIDNRNVLVDYDGNKITI